MSAAWRDSLGDAGIVNFFLGIIATGTVTDQLMTNALRLVGNTCGDSGESEHVDPMERGSTDGYIWQTQTDSASLRTTTFVLLLSNWKIPVCCLS